MPYSTEEDVIEETGFSNRDFLVEFMNKTTGEITAFINKKILEADRVIKRKLKIPYVILNEKHIGDGRTILVQLGPQDEDHGIDFNPQNCVEEIDTIKFNGERVLLPYPTNCELGTEGQASSWSGTNATISNDTVDFKCGIQSTKSIFSDAGYIAYDSGSTIDTNIFPWNYTGFWFKSTDSTATFTFRLYDLDGEYEEKTFNVDKNNLWKFIRLNIAEFSGTVDWSLNNLFQLRIYTDKACTIRIDNLNFNDGWCWTVPIGTINYSKISNGQGWFSSSDYVELNYKYDPFKSTVPEDIRVLSAKIAAMKLIVFLIGKRQEDTGFVVETDSFGTKQDKETLETTRARLAKEIDEMVNDLGYGYITGSS